MKPCPGCGSPLDDAATRCSFCGQEVTAETLEALTQPREQAPAPLRRKTPVPLALKLLLAMGLAGLAYYAWSVRSLGERASSAAPAPARQEAATFKIDY